MPTVNLRGVPVDFPFEPYEIQKDYMEKIIECLQNETNGVLESPTGTGKTLSLLCSTLAWLQLKKAQLQVHRQTSAYNGEEHGLAGSLLSELNLKVGNQGANGRAFMGLPTIIYASRTHSQLSQAMNELKRTSYNHMKASILGSRDQMCIHPEVIQEQTNLLRVQMCRIKVRSRACHFYNRVERKKEDPAISNINIIDIEDIVKLGNQHKFCPYYMSKELQKNADIIFMPYNYLLDPKARKALGVELSNNVIILDEAHNIERICEDAASLQIKSTDITLAIEEVTAVMKMMSEDIASFSDSESPKDFTAEELCVLKQMLLDFEAALDTIELTNGPEGTTFEGNYIFQLFEKANIRDNNSNMVTGLIDKITQFLVTTSDGPFQRKGNGIQLFGDLLIIAFASSSPSFKDKVQKCYKVHIIVEEPKKKNRDNWLSKSTAKPGCRVLNYWCFSPGFGMNMLMDLGIRCVILTSGTLAPLKPLISELELNVAVRLENPHIVTGKQICVKIIPKGPDGVILNCNYQNRDNPSYINSLGCTILNLIRQIPHGILIFFPSYPIMQKYQQFWQENGTWTSIYNLKPIYVEPRDKDSFNTAMTEFYSKINHPDFKGAIFMGVCRGKVSEGLDFADANGRAVMVTGLPYPPLKDPRVILKKRYLDCCHQRDKEFLKGDDWYSLEATRAVNQAIGRVIRHRHDYGAILLLDQRFDNFRVKSNLSLWLREHITLAKNFGEIVRDLKNFFRHAESTLPAPKMKSSNSSVSNNVPVEFELTKAYRKGNFDFTSESQSSNLNPNGSVVIYKRDNTNELCNPTKRKKINLIRENTSEAASVQTDTKEYISMVKKGLDDESYNNFVKAMGVYRKDANLNHLKEELDKIFIKKHSVRYLLTGLERYIKQDDKENFKIYLESMI